MSLLEAYDMCGYADDMVLELKLRKIGNSVGLVLPKKVLAHLKVSEGDTVYVTGTADRSVRISAARKRG